MRKNRYKSSGNFGTVIALLGLTTMVMLIICVMHSKAKQPAAVSEAVSEVTEIVPEVQAAVETETVSILETNAKPAGPVEIVEPKATFRISGTASNRPPVVTEAELRAQGKLQ